MQYFVSIIVANLYKTQGDPTVLELREFLGCRTFRIFFPWKIYLFIYLIVKVPERGEERKLFHPLVYLWMIAMARAGPS